MRGCCGHACVGPQGEYLFGSISLVFILFAEAGQSFLCLSMQPSEASWGGSIIKKRMALMREDGSLELADTAPETVRGDEIGMIF